MITGLRMAALALLLPATVLAGDPTVTICHFPPGNRANFQTITVSQDALVTHLTHGDFNGPCANDCNLFPSLCNDGNPCTTDVCNADGTCSNAVNVTCTASDQCHVAGTCNAATGHCSNPPAPNGTNCNDGNACTQTDTCQTGVCTGSNPLTCTAGDQCVIGVPPSSHFASQHCPHPFTFPIGVKRTMRRLRPARSVASTTASMSL